MTRLHIFITVAIILQGVPRGTCTAERGTTTNGFYIELNSGTIDSQQLAKDFCESTGGWLSEPKTKSISDDIGVMLTNLAGYYYGGLEKDNAGVWRWKDGSEPSWTNWGPGAPTGQGSCMNHGGGMGWYSNNCLETFRFLCQYTVCSTAGDCPTSNYDCAASDVDSSFTYCKCNPGYHGAACTDQNCSPKCQNGGICFLDSLSTDYKCQCNSGYFGNDCTEGYCEVHTNPCRNSGTCVSDHDTAPYYDCECVDGYYGNTCSEGYCEVNTDTCKNGGTCTSVHDTALYYDCKCVAGYHGNNCAEIITAPVITKVKSNNCSADGRLEVTWTPGLEGSPHRLLAVGVDGTICSVCEKFETPSVGEMNVTTNFEGLKISEEYQITVTSCPEMNCNYQPNAAATETTGPGVPPAVENPAVQQKEPDGECIVTWSIDGWEYTGEILYSEVTITEQFIVQPLFSEEYYITYKTSTPPGTQKHDEIPLPNRQYLFSIAATSCAGNSGSVDAVGTCLSDNAAVTSTPKAGEEFIALAIKRQEVSEISFNKLLGDNNETGCDITGVMGNINSNSYYSARNWPLQIGQDYSYYTVASTTNHEIFLFETSEIKSFENGETGSANLWIIGVAIGAAAIAFAVCYFIVKRRKLKNADRNQKAEIKEFQALDDDRSAAYQNPEVLPGIEEVIYSSIKDSEDGGYESVTVGDKGE